jgi:hypothetical protein
VRGVLALSALALVMMASWSADAATPRFRVGVGASFARYGGRRATGGWGPSPFVEVRLASLLPQLELAYRNAAHAFNFDSAAWIGVTDANALLFKLRVPYGFASAGPTIDLLTIPVCTDQGYCGRATGIAPGIAAELGSTYARAGTGPGVAVQASGRYVDNDAWSAVCFNVTALGTFAW